MFTGLIQGLGQILSTTSLGSQRRFLIRPFFHMDHIEDGESIAINGVCLSVESHRSQEFSAYASSETIARTTLGQLKTHMAVNLERAVKVGDRLGGHLVSGHVDCVATVQTMAQRGESLGFLLGFPVEFGAQVVEKGSVALDGISLTVNTCTWNTLEVNIIPDSRHRTNVKDWKPGSRVNMETDMIGKYVLRATSSWRSDQTGVDTGFLAEHGFI